MSRVKIGSGRNAQNRKLLIDSDAYRSLSDVAKYAKYTGRAFMGFDAVTIFWDTKKAYQEGGDWQKELFEGMAGMAGGSAGGWLVITIFTGAGWWIVIPGMVVALMGSEFFKLIAESLENKNGK